MSTIERRRSETIDAMREEIRMLRAALDADRDPYVAMGLPRQQAAVLAVMMRGGTRSRRAMEQAMESDRSTMDGRDYHHVETVIYNLRRKMKPHGIEIKTVYGCGYAMDDAARHRIRSLCEAGVKLGGVQS